MLDFITNIYFTENINDNSRKINNSSNNRRDWAVELKINQINHNTRNTFDIFFSLIKIDFNEYLHIPPKTPAVLQSHRYHQVIPSSSGAPLSVAEFSSELIVLGLLFAATKPLYTDLSLIIPNNSCKDGPNLDTLMLTHWNQCVDVLK